MEYVIISGDGERALMTSARHGWTEFCEDHVAFMNRSPEVALVSFETEDAARDYIKERGLNEFTRVVPKGEVVAVKVAVLMRHEWRDMGEGGDWTCNPVGVYANRVAAVAAACLTGFAEEENVEMYTVEFDLGSAAEVDAMGIRGVAV